MKAALLVALAASCGRAEFTPGTRGPYPGDQTVQRGFQPALSIEPNGELIAPVMSHKRGTLTIADVATHATRATRIPVPDAAALSSGVVYTVHATAIASRNERPTHSLIAATHVATDKLVWRTASASAASPQPQLLLSPDGARLAVIGDMAFVILDTRTGARLAKVAASLPTGLSIEAGLAVQTRESLSIYAWKDGASTCVVELPMAATGRASALIRVSPTRIAFRQSATELDSTAIVDVSACAIEEVLPGALDGVFGGAIFTVIDGKKQSFLPNSPGPTATWHLMAFDVSTKTRKMIGLPSAGHHVISPDGRHAVFPSIPSPGQAVHVLDVGTGELRAVEASAGLSPVSIAFAPDSARAFFIAAGSRLGSIEVATAKMKLVQLAEPDATHGSSRWNLAVAPNTGMIVVEDRVNGAITMFDPATLTRVATLAP
jgi:hypothetical protein